MCDESSTMGARHVEGCLLGVALSPREWAVGGPMRDRQSWRVAVCHDGAVREGTNKRQEEEGRAR